MPGTWSGRKERTLHPYNYHDIHVDPGNMMRDAAFPDGIPVGDWFRKLAEVNQNLPLDLLDQYFKLRVRERPSILILDEC